MDTIKINSLNTKMVAHRGVSGLERENSCAAFVAAGNRSYYGIETDVHVTRDGQFLCIHDDNTKRVSGDDLCVEETDAAVLRNVILTDMDGTKRRTDLKLPGLEEYVSICKRYGKTGVLELKNRIQKSDIERIIGVIRDEGYLDGIVFISFELDNLIDLRDLLPDQPCQYLTTECTDETIGALEKYRLGLDIYWKGMTQELVKTLHEKGVVVNLWTVDDPAFAETAVQWGVDMITSNILE